MFTKNDLYEIADSIKPADAKAMNEARKRQDTLAKPPGSLGRLEEMGIRMAGITGKVCNEIKKSCVIIMCSDNGVTEESVASTPQSVTVSQTVNFTRRLTGVGTLAESFGSELLIVDVGVKGDIPDELYDEIPLRDTHKIINRKIRRGTFNLAHEAAMTAGEAVRAMGIGIEMADSAKKNGFDIVGVGEMGIGNTTTSAAVLSSITGMDSSETCGRGSGLNDSSFEIKKRIVDDVSSEYRKLGKGWIYGERKEAREVIIDIVSKVGGFDICAMAGVFVGAAANKMPVVIDGYISIVAALVAYIIEPKSVDYMFASHKSFERGYSHAMNILGVKPFLDLDMRLGEGSGCPIAFEVIRGACDVMNSMATFEEAAINDDYLEEIRKGDYF